MYLATRKKIAKAVTKVATFPVPLQIFFKLFFGTSVFSPSLVAQELSKTVACSPLRKSECKGTTFFVTDNTQQHFFSTFFLHFLLTYWIYDAYNYVNIG